MLICCKNDKIMKTILMSLGIAFMAIACSPNDKNDVKADDAFCQKSECCKNCTDECAVLCKKVAAMSDADQLSDEGKKVLADCEAMCEKNGCCKAEDRKSCKAGNKACCDHHGKEASANNSNDLTGVACSADADCCKNCSEECMELCKKVAAMSDADQSTEEGKVILAECKAMCEKNDCCKAEDRDSCKHGEKGCCDHH